MQCLMYLKKVYLKMKSLIILAILGAALAFNPAMVRSNTAPMETSNTYNGGQSNNRRSYTPFRGTQLPMMKMALSPSDYTNTYSNQPNNHPMYRSYPEMHPMMKMALSPSDYTNTYANQPNNHPMYHSYIPLPMKPMMKMSYPSDYTNNYNDNSNYPDSGMGGGDGSMSMGGYSSMGGGYGSMSMGGGDGSMSSPSYDDPMSSGSMDYENGGYGQQQQSWSTNNNRGYMHGVPPPMNTYNPNQGQEYQGPSDYEDGSRRMMMQRKQMLKMRKF
uniref:Uncharacterized protein n=1 Tax=Acrobeloides nanus TaxID=290746 RepID=A0A914E0X8_9BILA